MKQIKISQLNYTVNCHGVFCSCIILIWDITRLIISELIHLVSLGMSQISTFADFEMLGLQWDKFAFFYSVEEGDAS